jgi:hypothetical protein
MPQKTHFFNYDSPGAQLHPRIHFTIIDLQENCTKFDQAIVTHMGCGGTKSFELMKNGTYIQTTRKGE